MTDKSATLAEQPPEPHAAVAGDVAVAAPRPRLGGLAGAIWAARSFWLALLGILFALNGQMLLVQHQPSVYAIRWYAAGLILLFVAWWGTYRNKSLLRVPEAAHTGTLPTRAKASEAASRPSRFPAWTHVAARYGVALLSLGLNLYSVSLLRSDYYSTVGSLSWLASLALLLAAFAGYRPRPGIDPDPPAADVEDRTDWRLPRRAELAVFLAILALGLFLRFYRLDDWNTGVFGDEGEAGTDALGIYEGNAVSPFEIGWFEQPNFYYWGIALGMKLFGPGLLGLRFFSAVAGSLMLLPFYPLVRLWFGVRAAIIATTLLAVSDVTIHFTRIELSNITTPLSLVLGFYFLFRGLRSRRVLEFVLSGYGFMLGLYFYSGARLTPYMLAAVLAYIFILLPLVRLPGVFRRWRQEEPGESPVRSLGRAALTQLRGVSHYGVQITALVIACVAFASPWYVYYTDHRTTMDSRTVDKLVFNQPQRMIDQYGVRHEPLFLGLRLPTSDDIYPVLPAAFEQTSLSVKLADDGFWPRVLWNQLTTTLSIFTMRHESCGFYSYTNEPIAKPLEAVLIVLGIAWALLRWRDTRMGVLNVWFWSTIVAGGVLTIDAPYMCRLIGIVPVDAIFPALIISKLSAEAVGVAGRGLLRLPSFARRSGWDTARVTRYGVAAAAVALLGYLTWQNFYDYYVRYMQVYPGGASTGQAVFVHQMNDKVMAEGRPAPRYYQMAAPILLWDYGTNRYLNHDTLGQDVQNVSDILPLLGDADRDAVFLAWDITEQYLPILRAYYPGGEETPFFYSPDGKSNYVFTAYRIKREQLLEGRHSVATYESAGQPTVTREESGLGTTSGLPASLKFPARATWTARLVAPGYGTYRFKLTATKHATLTIDDRQVLSVDASTTDPTREVILARGTHDVILEGDIDTAGDKVELGWLAGNVNFVPIESKYLWAGPGRGLLGELRALGGAGSDLAEDPPPDGPQPDDSTTPVFMRRVDDFLGLRATEDSASAGSAFLALWTGQLEITEPGNYRFEVYANGNAVVLIDDKPVVSLLADATDPTTESGEVELSPGSHAFKVRYNWMAGVGALEVYWTPPNGQRALMTSDVLHTGVGVWQPGAVSEPPFYQLPLGDKAAATTLAPQRLIGGSGDLLRPRGVGLDDEGNIYVGDRGHHRVVVYSREGKFIHAWGNAPPADDRRPRRGEFIDITDLAVTADGTVYVLDGGSPLLQVFDNEGIWQRTIDIGNLATYNPDGIALAADGSIYIADTGKNRVIKLPPGYDGNQPVLVLNGKLGKDGTERPNGRLRECVDVVVGGASGDSIYVADMTNRVVEFAPDGRLVQQWEIQVGGADGGTRIAPGPDGKTLYLSDPEHGRLSTLDLKTGAVRYFTGAGDEKSGLKQPSGIAVGPDGRLYVTDSARDNLKVYAPKK